MNWLITGGCGFIGTGLVENLLRDRNNNIRIIDNLSVGSIEQLSQVCNVDTDVDLQISDITDAALFTKLCDDYDVIVHLAAMSGVRESVEFPKIWFDNNVIGTFNVFESARINNIKKVVCASSSAAVGDVDPPIHERLPMLPISPYGASKSFMETFASAYHNSYGIDTVCLRFSNVYGPLSATKTSLVAKFIRYVMEGKTFNIYGSGEQTRDFIHLYDLIEAIKLAATVNNVGGETFQLSSATEKTINEIIKKLVDILNTMGYTAKYINTESKIGDIMTNWADNTKTREMLGWKQNIDLDEGLKSTVEWFIKEN